MKKGFARASLPAHWLTDKKMIFKIDLYKRNVYKIDYEFKNNT
jgi:hypothetical protein